MVIRFDVSSIPTDAKISEAVLSLYAYDNYSVKNGPKNLYKLTKDWDESSVTWRTPWSNQGGDYSQSAIAENNNTSVKVWEDYDVTSAIEEFVQDPYSNYGFILVFTKYSYGVKIYSSEYSDETLRPKLSITHEYVDNEPPNITVTSPDGGEMLTQGSEFDIVWDAIDNVEVIATAIYLSTDARASWELVDSVEGNTGSYSWDVPIVVSEKCKVKINVYDAEGNVGSDESDLVFSIDKPTGIINYKMYIPNAEVYKVTITNIQGRQIASFETNDIKKLNQMQTSLSSGMHIVNITTPEKTVIRKFWFVR